MPTQLDETKTRRARPMPSARGHERTAPANEVVVRVVGGEEARGAPRTKERSGFTFRGLMVSVLLGAVAVGLILLAGAVTGLFSIGNPFGTTRVDRTPPALLKQMTDLSDFHAAQGTFQVRVDVEDDVDILPSFLAGEHVLFNATGTVDASVDFSQLGADAVQVQDQTATIRLPRPEYGRAIIDPTRSSVVDRDRGVFTRVGDMFSDDTNNERNLYLLAGRKVTAAANASNLRARAEKNTTLMLEGLLGRLGYTDVKVVFEKPVAKGNVGQPGR